MWPWENLTACLQLLTPRHKEISCDGSWSSWIKFFLNAIIERSRETRIFYNKVSKLYEEMKGALPTLTRSGFAIFVIDYIFRYPIFSLPRMAEELKASPRALSPVLQKLETGGFITKAAEGRGRSSAIWHFVPLLALLAD